MKKILKPVILAYTSFCLLACSASGLFPAPTPGAGQTNPTANPDQPIEIVSQGDLSGEEVQDFVIGAQNDPQGNKLLAWAQQQGYSESPLKISGGGKVELSNGVTMRGVGMEKVVLLGYTNNGLNTPTYELARIEGTAEEPVLVLFDQTGQIEFSKNGIDAYRDGKKLGGSSMNEVSLASYHAEPNKQDGEASSCTDTNTDVFNRCMGEEILGTATIVACGSALVLSAAALGACSSTVVGAVPCWKVVLGALASGFVTKCPQLGICFWKSRFDDDPKVEIGQWARTGTRNWVDASFPNQTIRKIQVDVWKANVTVTDDRKPAPSVRPPDGWIQAASGQEVMVAATDCGRNMTIESSSPPGPSEAEMATAGEEIELPELPTPQRYTTATPETPVERTYSGYPPLFVRQGNPPGPWECASFAEHDLGKGQMKDTYLFPGDGTVIRTKSDGVEWEVVFQPVAEDSNNREYQYMTSDSIYTLQFSADMTSLSFTEDRSSPDGSRGQCTTIWTQVSN